MARIALVGGAGYVGAAYTVALAELGHDIVGLDLDLQKVDLLCRGCSPIYESGLEELLRRGLRNGRLRFTTSYAEAIPDADFVFICVGTPPDGTGRAETSYVVAATREIARHSTGHTFRNTPPMA